MAINLSEDDAEIFIKFCGMLGSDFTGEIEAAAKKATKVLKQNGYTWLDFTALITTKSNTNQKISDPWDEDEPAKKPYYKVTNSHSDVCDNIDILMTKKLLYFGEESFLSGIVNKSDGDLSDRQQAWVDKIRHRAKAKGVKF